NPSCTNRLPWTRLPCAVNRQIPGNGSFGMPPWQCDPGGGFSRSGESWGAPPPAPRLAITLSRPVAYGPPGAATPGPTPGMSPGAGTFALLVPAIRLCSMIRHDLVVLPGHRPSCGGGASSLLSEFGASPVRLRVNSESMVTRRPPEFVPE